MFGLLQLFIIFTAEKICLLIGDLTVGIQPPRVHLEEFFLSNYGDCDDSEMMILVMILILMTLILMMNLPTPAVGD